jgi:chromosome partitioning protein
MHALLVVESVRACRANPLPVVIVPTRIDLRTLEGRQILNELEGLGEPVTQPLGYRADFVRAYSAGQSISTFAPGSPADDEIRALADEILSGLATEPNQSAAAQDGVVGTAAADA